MPKTGLKNVPGREAYIITGPTSGIGRATAYELAKHGTVVLVGRDRGRLAEVQRTIERRDQQRGLGRVRPVGSGERAARGGGDRRAKKN
jgi:NAD(P)-dependent dehydrogenase (short-subunit alcohol dehydrogenase family)